MTFKEYDTICSELEKQLAAAINIEDQQNIYHRLEIIDKVYKGERV